MSLPNLARFTEFLSFQITTQHMTSVPNLKICPLHFKKHGQGNNFEQLQNITKLQHLYYINVSTLIWHG